MVSPNPSAARNNSSCVKFRDKAVAAQITLQICRPDSMDVFRFMRSTTNPAKGPISPYTQANDDPSNPSCTGVNPISRSSRGNTEKMAWRSA